MECNFQNYRPKKELSNIFHVLMAVLFLAACGSGSSSSPANGAGNNNGGGGLPADSVLITWDGPTVNANAGNTPLSDLAGYRVYMTTVSGVYSPANIVAQISASPTGGGTEKYQINNLAPGTYYFVVTAYDNAVPANESVPTSEVSKIIP